MQDIYIHICIYLASYLYIAICKHTYTYIPLSDSPCSSPSSAPALHTSKFFPYGKLCGTLCWYNHILATQYNEGNKSAPVMGKAIPLCHYYA